MSVIVNMLQLGDLDTDVSTDGLDFTYMRIAAVTTQAVDMTLRVAGADVGNTVAIPIGVITEIGPLDREYNGITLERTPPNNTPVLIHVW